MASSVYGKSLSLMELKEQKIPEARVLPGMILSFSYAKQGAYDRRPLLFVMFVDKTEAKLHGVNLNYLKEYDVQLLFSEMQRIGASSAEENYLQLAEPYYRFGLTTRFDPSKIDGDYVYRMIFHRRKRFKQAYRTYLLKDATSMKVVNYAAHKEYTGSKTMNNEKTPETYTPRGRNEANPRYEGGTPKEGKK